MWAGYENPDLWYDLIEDSDEPMGNSDDSEDEPGKEVVDLTMDDPECVDLTNKDGNEDDVVDLTT